MKYLNKEIDFFAVCKQRRMATVGRLPAIRGADTAIIINRHVRAIATNS